MRPGVTFPSGIVTLEEKNTETRLESWAGPSQTFSFLFKGSGRYSEGEWIYYSEGLGAFGGF